jgi:hypothetical protein
MNGHRLSLCAVVFKIQGICMHIYAVQCLTSCLEVASV